MSAPLDRTTLLDASHCPACGASLDGPRCAACGVDLSGAGGRRLWELSQRIVALLEARDSELVKIKTAALSAEAKAPAPVAAAVAAPAIPVPLPVAAPETSPWQPSVESRSSHTARIGVQGVLVGLGALLLAVAAIVFLVFSWDRLSLTGRAVIIAVFTLAALGGAAWLRPRLVGTAEAIGAVAVVLVLGDAWAIYATGLFGADRIDTAEYTAISAAVAAVVLGVWAVLSGVRGGSWAAAVLAPAAPAILGGWAADRFAEPAYLAIGLLVAIGITTIRAITPAPWAAERVILRSIAAALVPTSAVVVLVVEVHGQHLLAALLILLTAALCAGQAVTDHRCLTQAARQRSALLWSAGTGVFSVLASIPVAGALVRGLDLESAVLLGLPCALAAAVTLGWARGWRRAGAWPRQRWNGDAAVAAAAFTAAAQAVPAALVAAAEVVRAAGAAVPPWRAATPWSLGDLVIETTPANGITDGVGTGFTDQVAAIVALAAVAVLLPAADRRFLRFGVFAAALGLLAAPLSLATPVLLCALILMGEAVLLVVWAQLTQARLAADEGFVSRGALLAGSACLVLGVVLTWTVPWACVPGTLAGAAALWLARLTTSSAQPRALFAAAATISATVAAGAAVGLVGPVGTAETTVPERFVVAGICGALLAALAVGAPFGRSVSQLERCACAIAGFAVAGVALLVAAGSDPLGQADWSMAARLAAVLGAVLPAAIVGLAWPPDRAPAGVSPFPPLGAALPAVSAGFAAALAATLGAPADAQLIAAAAAACAIAVALAVLGLSSPTDIRRRPAELGSCAVGVALIVIAAGRSDGGPLWIVLLLVGSGAAAVSIAPDRRRVAWLAWGLLTASSWLRLRHADVALIEAYTVPPAVALLSVAAIRLRRDRRTEAWRAIGPGVSLALLPSVLASASGSAVRPAMLMACGVILVMFGFWRKNRFSVPFLVAGALAAGAGVIRALSGLEIPSQLTWGAVEAWSLPAAAIMTVSAVVINGRYHQLAQHFRGSLLEPVLFAATLPSLLALGTAIGAPEAEQHARLIVPRAVALLAGCGLPACAELLPPLRRTTAPPAPTAPTALISPRLTVEATLLAGLTALAGLVADVTAAEWWTLSFALVLAARGSLALAAAPGLRSWQALGPALAIGLLPSLWLASVAGPDWRIAGVTVLGVAVVVIGSIRRLQAAVVIGGCVLAAHAVVQLGPWLAHTVATVPRWVVLGLAGALLLSMGATYERRLHELKSIRLRINTLR